jgi:hypothetical protein
LRVRALFAARLYSRGFVRAVIPSGGVGNNPPSEAAAISEVLRNAGVPDEDILLEEQGRSTQDSARLVTKLARARGIEDGLDVQGGRPPRNCGAGIRQSDVALADPAPVTVST